MDEIVKILHEMRNKWLAGATLLDRVNSDGGETPASKMLRDCARELYDDVLRRVTEFK